MTEPVFLTIDLPPDAAAEDVSALRDYLENRITENEGMTAEVDVADPARAGGFEPALIIAVVAAAVPVAKNLSTIMKTIKEAKDLFSSKSEPKPEKAELTPVQKLLLTIDPEKIIVRVDGKDVPITALVPPETA